MVNKRPWWASVENAWEDDPAPLSAKVWQWSWTCGGRVAERWGSPFGLEGPRYEWMGGSAVCVRLVEQFVV